MRAWPRSLYGRVALVIFTVLALAHALTFASLLRERGELGRRMMAAYFGRDVATAVAVLDHLPPAQRPAWLPRLARHNYRYDFATPEPAVADDRPLATELAALVAAELGPQRVGTPRRDGDTLALPLRLADGSHLLLWLQPPSPWPSATSVALLALQLALLAAVTAWGVRLAVRPLERLAAAADATHEGIAPGSRGPRVDEHGPREVVQAARAFNAMQQRIEQQLAERLQLLAAISHDLQSPITRLRLRLEQLPDAGLRDRLQADLASMQALVEEGLAYARSAQAVQEPLQAVDLDALLDGLVCDAGDAGHDAQLEGRLGTPLLTRAQALRRLLTNLIDNALKFSGPGPTQLRLRLRHDPQDAALPLQIAVLDRGPGIPEGALAQVLQPFYRVEGSRSRETGGTGLGLAIAQQLALALGGRLSLHNRPDGGLEARLALPLTPPSTPASTTT